MVPPRPLPRAKGISFLVCLRISYVCSSRMFVVQNSGGKFMRVKALVLVAVTLILAASAWASSESVLYNFCSLTSCVDGNTPYGSLVADTSGNHLYGTTYQGGANG